MIRLFGLVIPQIRQKLFETCIKVNRWPEEDKLTLVSNYLDDSVQEWFYDGDFDKWDSFVGAFTIKYGEKVDLAGSFISISTIHMTIDETLQGYLERFNAQQKKYSKALASVDSLNHLQDKDFAKIFV